ncbi:MAG: hypothetical protein M3416_01420 [Acidobacteriota bacterium]|nr:hypothetical protein [Acidobacteriota bacterium]
MSTVLKFEGMTEARARKLTRQVNESFTEAGRILKEMRDSKGYELLGYQTFESYLKAEVNYSRVHAWRLIESVEISDRVLPVGNALLPETHARVLRLVPEERQAEVYDEVVKTAETSKKKVSAQLIADTLKRRGLLDEDREIGLGADSRESDEYTGGENPTEAMHARLQGFDKHRLLLFVLRCAARTTPSLRIEEAKLVEFEPDVAGEITRLKKFLRLP